MNLSFFCSDFPGQKAIYWLCNKFRQKGSYRYAPHCQFFTAAEPAPTLTGCGQSAATGNTQDPAPEPSEEAPPTPEPYTILDPTVQPEGGERDGVAYTAYNGVVEHLFFHPVVAYPELAFDGDNQANGIDDYMVTADEYKKILQSVYDKGYILVDINSV